MLTGPWYHSDRVHQYQHRQIPEPLQSQCFWSADGVQDGDPPPPLPAPRVFASSEDMVSGATGQIVSRKMWLHIGDRSGPFQNGGNKGCQELFLRPFRPVGYTIADNSGVVTPFPLPPRSRGIQPFWKIFPRLEGPGTSPLPLKRPPRPQWIPKTSTWLMDESSALLRNPWHNRKVVHTLTKTVWRSLLLDSRQQAEKAAEEIGAWLKLVTENSDLQGVYTVLK